MAILCRGLGTNLIRFTALTVIFIIHINIGINSSKSLTAPYSSSFKGLSSNEKAIKILFTLVALGNDSPNDAIALDNLNAAIAMGKNSGGRYKVDCLIFSYASYPGSQVVHDMKTHWLHDRENSTTPACEILTMFEMSYVGWLKMLMPSLLRAADYKYLFISIDDVALTPKYGASCDLMRFFDVVESHQLEIASCAIEGTPHRHLRPQEEISPGQIGRLVNMIEIQATAFEINAWECMHELVDTEYPGGWGLDLWFWNYCADRKVNNTWRMGVIDTMKVVHNPLGQGSRNNWRNPDGLMKAQEQRWSQSRGIGLRRNYGGTISILYGAIPDTGEIMSQINETKNSVMTIVETGFAAG
jgi:hypothetical protein